MGEQPIEKEPGAEIEIKDKKYERLKRCLAKNWILVPNRLYREEKEQIMEPLYQKYSSYLERSFATGALSIDTEQMEFVEGEEKVKEYEKEAEPYYQKLENFIKEKPAEEIYQKAEQIVDNLTKEKNFEYALIIAKPILSKEKENEIWKEYCKNELEKLKELKDQKEISAKAREILEAYGLKFQVAALKEAEILNLIELCQDSAFSTFVKTKSFVESGQIKKTNQKIYEMLRPEARERIEKLIKQGREKEALEKAEYFEKIGFLNLESDSDLFEKLTETAS